MLWYTAEITLKFNLRRSKFSQGKPPNSTYQQNSQDKVCIQRLPKHVSCMQGTHICNLPWASSILSAGLAACPSIVPSRSRITSGTRKYSYRSCNNISMCVYMSNSSKPRTIQNAKKKLISEILYMQRVICYLHPEHKELAD